MEKHRLKKNCKETPGSIFVEIPRSSPTCDKPSVKLKTFGRRDNSASETESFPGKCEPNLTRKSFSLNGLTTTSWVQETKSPFYGPGDQGEEATQPFTQLVLITASQVKRSSSDKLATQIPRRPETFRQRKTVLPGVKGTIEQVKPRKSDSSKIQKVNAKTVFKNNKQRS